MGIIENWWEGQKESQEEFPIQKHGGLRACHMIIYLGKLWVVLCACTESRAGKEDRDRR